VVFNGTNDFHPNGGPAPAVFIFDKHDDMPGPGLGFVTVFDTTGRRLVRLQHGDWFNAPWGIAMAPGEFGEFSHALLVGMFGSGQSTNRKNGRFRVMSLKADNVA
jgi:hypothetical protein